MGGDGNRLEGIKGSYVYHVGLVYLECVVSMVLLQEKESQLSAKDFCNNISPNV